MVQPQLMGKHMPVEDATVEWSEKDSPFIPLARIEIKSQKFDTPEQQEFCENLSYNPWHARPEHRPLGVMNRIRRAVYQEVGRYRRCQNGVAFSEPLDNTSLALPGQPCEIPPENARK
jgi:hypothetical protein